MQMPIAFQQCQDEEDYIITNLKICKIRSLSRNQLQKLDMPENASNFASKTRNSTKLPPKEVKFQKFPNNMHIKEL